MCVSFYFASGADGQRRDVLRRFYGIAGQEDNDRGIRRGHEFHGGNADLISGSRKSGEKKQFSSKKVLTNRLGWVILYKCFGVIAQLVRALR